MKKNLKHTFVILAYKESPYLESCIKSILNQTIKTNIILATSTFNNFIKKIAKKYELEVQINKEGQGIAEDFNFAYECAKTNLVTIAHQDDIYESDYVETIIHYYQKYQNATILFTNYYEIRENQKIINSPSKKVKQILLIPLYFKTICFLKMVKRNSLRFGNAICCPTVTFSKKNITIDKIFTSNFISNMDWLAWERISRLKGSFIYINKILVGHRIHDEATTSKLIQAGKRTSEDYEMFLRFWPKWIAKIINKFYKLNEATYKKSEF